jgi:hypothetical protein
MPVVHDPKLQKNLLFIHCRDAGDAKVNDFSFAVERTAKENRSTVIFFWWLITIYSTKLSFSRKDKYFCFPPSQRKSKKELILSVLCVSAVRKKFTITSLPV